MPDDPDNEPTLAPARREGEPSSGQATIVRSDVAAARELEDSTLVRERGGAGADDDGPVTPETPGRYGIEREYGRGGQSRVLLAIDTHVGREIALKELLPEPQPGGTPASQTGAAAARFLREARITGQLEHPNIVPVYEVGRHDDGTLYYTQKLVRGDTFKKALRAARTLEERLKLLGHFADICQAVAYAHSRGVIHRDLKPENVMVGEFGETVVLDWGLAKARGQKDLKASQLEREAMALRSADATVEGLALGTPSYMSPEQALGKLDEIDERSDVWSLGAILYEILTGHPPYEGGTAHSVIEKVIRDPVRPVKEVLRDAPPELCAVAERALSRDRLQRYASAAEVARDVEAYRAGRNVSAYAYSSLDLFKRFVQKNRALSAVSASAVVLILAALFAVAREYGKAQGYLDEARTALGSAKSNLAAAFLEKAHAAERDQLWHRADIFYAAARVQQDSPEARWGTAIEGEDASGMIRISGHSGDVVTVQLSPAGDTLASGSVDGTARIFSLTTGRELFRYQAPAVIEVVAWSGDAKQLATRDADGVVRVHDVKTGALLRSVKLSEGRGSLAFLGSRLFVSSSLRARSVDVESGAIETLPFAAPRLAVCGRRLLVAQSNRLFFADLSPQAAGGRPADALSIELPLGRHEIACGGGRIAVTLSDRSIRLYSDAGKLLATLVGHSDAVTRVAVSSDGLRLASASDDRTVRLWDAATGQALASLPRPGPALWVDFAPDGQSVAVGETQSAVLLWDVTPGEQGLPGTADQFAFLPDGGFVAAGSAAVLARFGKDGKLTASLRDAGPIVDLALSPDGARAATVLASGDVSVWDLQRGKRVQRIAAGAQRAIFLRDGRLLAEVAGKAIVLEPLQALATFENPVEQWAMSPDGKLLFALVSPSRLMRIEVQTGRVLPAMDLPVSALALSARGDLLALGSYGKALLVDPATLAPRGQVEIEGAIPLSLAFSPDGGLLAASGADGMVRLYETASRREMARLPVAAARLVRGLSFSPDGRRLHLRVTGSTATLGGVRFVRLGDPAALPAPQDQLARVLRDHGVSLEGTRVVGLPPPVSVSALPRAPAAAP